MNFGIEKFKNSYMNFAGMKYRLKHPTDKQTSNTKEEESIKSTINSFRQAIPQSNKSTIKYITSKNSPERPSDRSNISKPINLPDNPIKVNSNRYILSKSQSKEKYFEAILKKKLMQSKEKHKFKEKDQKYSNSNSNIHAQTNYLSKVKNKITLETSLQIKMPFQAMQGFNSQSNTNSHSKSNSHSNSNTNVNVIRKAYNLATQDKLMMSKGNSGITTPKLKSLLAINHDLNVNGNCNGNSHRLIKGISKTSLPSQCNSRKPSIDYKGNANPIANVNERQVQIQLQVQKQLRQKSESQILQSNHHHFKPDSYNIWKVLKESITKNPQGGGSSRKSSSKAKEIAGVKGKYPLTSCSSPKNNTMKVNTDEQDINTKGKSNLRLDMDKIKYFRAVTDKDPNSNSTTNNQPFLNKINESLSVSMESCMREPSYYQNEKDALIRHITHYYNEKSAYPKTNESFYLYGRVLGKGNFGKVNLALHVLTGRLVAIKTINKTKHSSENQVRKNQIETAIMKRLRYSSVAQIYETFETSKYVFIVMEYLGAGDLLRYIRKRSKLSESTSKFIFKQIIEALSFIHSMRIVHRDIKLDNILIDLDNTIKICDFGVSRKIGREDVMMEQCGTPAYIAPEILKGRGYQGYAVDIWSAGVSLYVMLTGTVPFKGTKLDELYELIKNSNIKDMEIEGISPDAKHLLGRLLEIDPKKRITITQILNHPWLINVDTNIKAKANLFTNAERILLAKSNIDYCTAPKEDLIEHFTIKNLDSMNEAANQNINTKSHILAPFNSSMDDIDDEDDGDAHLYDCIRRSLPIQNNVMKFTAKVKEINRNYELNNNGEIDNGVVISPHESNSPVNEEKGSIGKVMSPSKIMSPVNERVDGNGKKIERVKEVINEAVLRKVEMLGYNREYVRLCLEENEINHATTCYYLLLKCSDCI